MAAGEPIKLLIVDDESLIRQGIKHYINWEQEGFRIVGEAANGREALELIEQERPHIVLTDIVMPLMDGEELTREIKARYPEIEVVVLSSFGEFDYVRSTFQSGVADYILKPMLEVPGLLKVLRKTADKLGTSAAGTGTGSPLQPVDQLIERLIAGYETEIDQRLIAGSFPYDRYVLLGVDLRRLSIDAQRASRGLTRILNAIAADGLPMMQYRMATIDQNTVVMLLNVPDTHTHGLAASIRRAAVSAADDEPELVIVQSEPFRQFGQIGRVYKEQLHKLLQYSFYLADSPLLALQDLPADAPQVGTFNLNQFTDEFKRFQFEPAFDRLREHTAALSAAYTTDVFEYKSFLSNMIFTITVLLGNMGYDIKDLELAKYACFNAIDQARDAAEAANQLYRFIDQAIGCLGVASPGPGKENMKALLDYIDRHYAEPLSLKEMARHFHFNPSYLSSYFTTHNKESFIEYLNRIRIAKASELLLKDSATISEISDRVGYSDHSYFCKVFKKMTGQSPSQYRRQYQK